MMATVSKRGKYYIVKDGSSEYTVDSSNGSISEKSSAGVAKADCKIVMTAVRNSTLTNKIMKRYWHLFN
jgi:hypothetical protein